MNSPIITWYVKDNESFIQEEEFYYGSINYSEKVNIIVQVWNNRYGVSDVENISNANMILYFENFEDNMLLNYCTIKVNGNKINTSIELDKIIAPIGALSGSSNNGISSNINTENFKSIELIFENFPQNLKKGLKSIYLDIEIN